MGIVEHPVSMKPGYWLTRGCLIAHVGTRRDRPELFTTPQQKRVASARSNFWSGTCTLYRIPLMGQNFYWTDEGFCRPDGVENESDVIQFISPEMGCRQYIALYNHLIVYARRNKVSVQTLREHIVCKALLKLAVYTLDQHAMVGVKKYIPAIIAFYDQLEKLSNEFIHLRWQGNGQLIYTDEKSPLHKLLAGTPDQQSVVIEEKNLHLLMELVHAVEAARIEV